MAHLQLSQGAIQTLIEQGTIDGTPFSNAMVQVLNFRPIDSPKETTGPKRYRLLISDGIHQVVAMLATQMNNLVENGELCKNGIVRLERCVTNMVGGKRVVIILLLEVLTPRDASLAKIGNPVSLNDGSKPAESAPSIQQPIQSVQQNVAHVPSGYQNQFGSVQAPSYPVKQEPSVPSMSIKPSQTQAVFPIKSLSPYQNKWMICARVVTKSDIRTWTNQRGEGRLFSVTFADESGEIRATTFNQGVTMFYDVLQENQVYFVSNAAVKIAKRQYSNVDNDYELTLDEKSIITPCTDTAAAPVIKYNRVMLAQLGGFEKDASVDIIGVIKESSEATEFVSKAGKKLTKRELTVVDESNYQVRLTLWGKSAESFNTHDQPVVAFKGVKVNDYGGRSLSLSSGGSLQVNPDIREAHVVKGWFDNMAKLGQLNFQSFANTTVSTGQKRDDFKLISQITDEHLGHGEKPDYLTIRGSIIFIKNENAMYPACPGEDCNKKVTEDGNGWRCERCSRTWPAPNYRYILPIGVCDHSGHVWLQGFNEIGEQILGRTANELADIKNYDADAYKKAFNDVVFKEGTFKIRAKQETYNDETRLRCSIVSYHPINYVEASNHLIEFIEQYRK